MLDTSVLVLPLHTAGSCLSLAICPSIHAPQGAGRSPGGRSPGPPRTRSVSHCPSAELPASLSWHWWPQRGRICFGVTIKTAAKCGELGDGSCHSWTPGGLVAPLLARSPSVCRSGCRASAPHISPPPGGSSAVSTGAVATDTQVGRLGGRTDMGLHPKNCPALSLDCPPAGGEFRSQPRVSQGVNVPHRPHVGQVPHGSDSFHCLKITSCHRLGT
jgi:hypothetical protein